MKSTWLHSSLLIIVASLALAAAATLRFSAIGSTMANPIAALSLLVPGLALGWFTRRHPLVVGAMAGAISPPIAFRFFASAPPTSALAGDCIASSLTVAVAALAGRALWYRVKS